MTKRELFNLILEHQGWEIKSKKNTSPELCECSFCYQKFYPNVRFHSKGDFSAAHFCENCLDNTFAKLLEKIKDMKYYE